MRARTALFFKRYKSLLRVLISLLLLAYVARQIDWRAGLSLMPRANLVLMALAVILLTLERIVSVLKWFLLLRARGGRISFGRLLIINYVGGFWGLILPSSVSADIVRGYYLARTSAGLALTVTSMFMDRVLSGLALLSLAALGGWLAGNRFGFVHHRAVIALGLGLAGLALALLTRPAVLGWLERVIAQRGGQRPLQQRLRAWLQFCLEYRRYRGLLARTFGLSILMQVIRVLVFYLVAEAFQVHIPMLYYLLFTPIITVLIMLPVAFGGIGIREGSFVAFFTLVGVGSADAFVISFTVSLLTILTTAVGGVIYLCDKGAQPPAPSQST